MSFWQQLRWRIVAVNMLVAAVGVGVVLVCAAVIMQTTVAVDQAEQASALQSESDVSGIDIVVHESLGADAAMILRKSFVDSIPIAVIVALVSSMIASLLMTQAIMAPMNRLAKSSQRIARGHYAERLSVSGDDEVAQLATSLNQLAEVLDQSEERRIAHVGYLSHELRTPLSGIAGYIEGIMDGVFPDTDATLALMYGEVRRMRRLVDDLQTLSQVQSGQISLRMGTFELSSFVERATVKLRPQWINSGVEVFVLDAEQAMVVYADPDRVDQILLNLLANSLANTPEGGRITINLVKDGFFARVDIQDSGCGISEEDLPYIFERYYRADNVQDHESSNSGIGLTISQHLARSMGGEIIAKSDGPGKGSAFSFSLPISKSYLVRE